MLELHEAGDYAPKTLNNALAVLVAALNGAVADHLLPQNPVAGVERIPLGHVERDWLRLHEIAPYLDACAPVYRPLAELLIGSGLRISEALALQWDDIDFRAPRGSACTGRPSARARAATKGKRFRAGAGRPSIAGHDARPACSRRRGARRRPDACGGVFAMPVRYAQGRARALELARTGFAPIDRNTVSRDWHKLALEAAGLTGHAAACAAPHRGRVVAPHRATR